MLCNVSISMKRCYIEVFLFKIILINFSSATLFWRFSWLCYTALSITLRANGFICRNRVSLRVTLLNAAGECLRFGAVKVILLLNAFRVANWSSRVEPNRIFSILKPYLCCLKLTRLWNALDVCRTGRGAHLLRRERLLAARIDARTLLSHCRCSQVLFTGLVQYMCNELPHVHELLDAPLHISCTFPVCTDIL